MTGARLPANTAGMVRLPLVVALAAVTVAGCQCQCSNQAVIRSDGGAGGELAADGGSSTGGGAGGGAGGSGGGGSGGFDAGDGTTQVTIGPGAFTLDGGSGGQGSGVTLDPNGYVVLSQGSAEFHFMWIANDTHGWVSKYDTRTGKEVARYWSVIPKDCANSAGPPCAGGVVHDLRADQSWHPSRTAIDLFSDVWVANRGIGKQGSVTKIANDAASCVDRNGNGRIETSRDVNGDGEISMNPADGEMILPTDVTDPAQYDECVLFTAKVGAVPPGGDVGARALAVSAGVEGGPGDVWVGIWHEQRMYKLSASNGAAAAVNAQGTPYVQLSFGPYGAIVDRLQRVWVTTVGEARMAAIDASTGTKLADPIVGPMECSAYGIAIDGKNRVWLPGWTLGAAACRYDHAAQAWQRFDFSTARSPGGTAFQWGRGIAVDAEGRVYMSGFQNGVAQLIRFDAESGALVPFAGAQFVDMSDTVTGGSIGVGLDSDGHPWVNNSSGNATRVDRLTGQVTWTPQQPAGLYTYSDFTGYQLRNFTAPRGTYRRDFEACEGENVWKTLTWDVATPPNTSVQVFVKAAATRPELDSTSLVRYGPFSSSPVDLSQSGLPHTRYLRVEFVLRSADGQATPVLRRLDVTWRCGATIN